MSRFTCDELEMIIAEKAADDPQYAIAYGLSRIAHEIHRAVWNLTAIPEQADKHKTNA